MAFPYTTPPEVPTTIPTSVITSTSSSTIETVEHTSTTSAGITTQPTPNTTAQQITLTSITTTRPPTPTTTTMTRQIKPDFTTTTVEPSEPIPLLSTESSRTPAPTTHSGPSFSMASTTVSFILGSPSLTSNAPSSTSGMQFSTSNNAGVRISRILPAVLVPMVGLIAILAALLLIRRSRRRMRENRATENPLPFLSQSPTPGLSSALATNAGLSEKQTSLRLGSDTGFPDFVRNEGLGNEGELRTREEASAGFVGGSGTVPGLREQIHVLQAQLADIGKQRSSHAPPDYNSIYRQ